MRTDKHTDLQTPRALLNHAEQLLRHSEPADVAKCARLLALNVAIYKARYGEITEQDYLDLLGDGEPGREAAQVFELGLHELLSIMTLVSGTTHPKEHTSLN